MNIPPIAPPNNPPASIRRDSVTIAPDIACCFCRGVDFVGKGDLATVFFVLEVVAVDAAGAVDDDADAGGGELPAVLGLRV